MNQVPATLSPETEGLLTELDLGSARGGKAGTREPLIVVAVRPLTEADLPAISNPPPLGSQVQPVKNLRHSHHQLAQLISEGKEYAEISRLTGYSPVWITNLQTDPAFNELVTYYAAQRELVFVDAVERMKIIGLDAAEKLHENLHDQTKEWSNRELMEVIELALGPSLNPKTSPGSPAGAGSSISLEVKFVGTPEGASPRPGGVPSTSLDLPFTDLTPKEG